MAINDPAAIRSDCGIDREAGMGRRRRKLLVASSEVNRVWIRRYLTVASVSDGLVITASVLAAQWIRFGADARSEQFYGALTLPVPIISLLLVVSWLLSLRVFQTVDRRIIGAGASEYSKIVTASFALFGGVAILGMVFQIDLSRGYFAIALPLGTLGLLVSRWLWRQVLVAQRKRKRWLDRVLVVGDSSSVAHLADRLTRSPQLGYDVVGACVPGPDTQTSTVAVKGAPPIPILGTYDDVPLAVSASGATTCVITSASALGHEAMQELSWEMQGLDVEMLVAPGVTDVAGPRMMVRPVSGLPLLHIDRPRYEGANRFRKAAIDTIGALLLLLVLIPVMVATAVAVKLDSRGPVFYRAARVGLNNRPFMMWKFRSMVVDADKLRGDLAHQNEGAGVLFKIQDDPRVTRVGKVLRRYSLDEIPQLFNVVAGHMSLVGPRPPLPEEVERYDGRVARRMLVKPGMTGLWQVSGRSDLTWEESVRLDLSYVENWSVMQDLVILWRTARAVVAKDGAY